MNDVHKTCAKTAAVSRGINHATTKERYRYTTSMDINNTQGLRCLLEICVNQRETLRILRQWHEKCIQYNLELMHITKLK